MLKKIDELIMEVWNDKSLTNEMKNEVVKKLQEIQMLLQEGSLCTDRAGKRLL